MALVSALAMVLLGALAGAGVLAVVAGVRGQAVLPSLGPGAARRGAGPGRSIGLLALAVALAAATYALTGWVVGAALAMMAVPLVPRAASAGRRHQAEVSQVEAIATWTEQLRDTMAAAHGLEQAVAATATVAPSAIAPEVARLAARLDHVGLAEALRGLADDIDHPACDFVVAGLVTAAERQARDLGPLLSQLASCARDEAQMRSRVWAGRARTRTSVRVISGSIALFALGLLVLNRSYLAPYDSATGQLMLLAIGATFAGAVGAMDRMGRIAVPERFVRRRQEEAA
jgi:hypothetical protein